MKRPGPETRSRIRTVINLAMGMVVSLLMAYAAYKDEWSEAIFWLIVYCVIYVQAKDAKQKQVGNVSLRKGDSFEIKVVHYDPPVGG